MRRLQESTKHKTITSTYGSLQLTHLNYHDAISPEPLSQGELNALMKVIVNPPNKNRNIWLDQLMLKTLSVLGKIDPTRCTNHINTLEFLTNMESNNIPLINTNVSDGYDVGRLDNFIVRGYKINGRFNGQAIGNQSNQFCLLNINNGVIMESASIPIELAIELHQSVQKSELSAQHSSARLPETMPPPSSLSRLEMLARRAPSNNPYHPGF